LRRWSAGDESARDRLIPLVYDRLRELEDTLFARFDLTAQQYNALRLLRTYWRPGT